MKRAAKDSLIIEIVARNVRVARKAAGLSQEELAHEARIDRTYISQVERKQRNLTISVLARISRALGTTPDKLLIPPTDPSSRSVRKRRAR
jgi:transcriptional regulator with XRE-family HTH domain